MRKCTLALLTLMLAWPVWAMDKWQQFNDKTIALYRKQAYQQAIPYAQKALKLAKSEKGDKAPLTLTSMNNLAKLYHHTEQYALAQTLFEQTLLERQHIFGKQHPHTLISQSNLIALYVDMKNYPAASQLAENRLSDGIDYASTSKQTHQQNLKTLIAIYQAHIGGAENVATCADNASPVDHTSAQQCYHVQEQMLLQITKCQEQLQAAGASSNVQ